MLYNAKNKIKHSNKKKAFIFKSLGVYSDE